MTKKSTQSSIVRSSAAEYLTFVAASGQGGVEAIYADESIWLTQKMMGELYDVETNTINYHLKKVFSDSELEEISVIPVSYTHLDVYKRQIFTYLHLAPDPQQTELLLASGTTAIAYETVTNSTGGLPLLAPMSEVAGRMSIQALSLIHI